MMANNMRKMTKKNRIMNKPFAAITVCLAMAAMTMQAQTPQEWRDSLVTQNRLIDRQPRSIDLRLKKAAVNIELNQWEYAAEEYGNVLRLEPENLTALYFRAYANTHLRQYALAKSDYEAVLRIVPMNMEARLGLARVKELMGRKTDARDEYNQLVEMFPDSAVCYASRAAFETTQAQYEIALYDWTEAIKRQPRNADYVATKVELLLKLERREEAQKELKEALQRGIPRGVLREWIGKCRKQ